MNSQQDQAKHKVTARSSLGRPRVQASTWNGDSDLDLNEHRWIFAARPQRSLEARATDHKHQRYHGEQDREQSQIFVQNGSGQPETGQQNVRTRRICRNARSMELTRTSQAQEQIHRGRRCCRGLDPDHLLLQLG